MLASLGPSASYSTARLALYHVGQLSGCAHWWAFRGRDSILDPWRCLTNSVCSGRRAVSSCGVPFEDSSGQQAPCQAVICHGHPQVQPPSSPGVPYPSAFTGTTTFTSHIVCTGGRSVLEDSNCMEPKSMKVDPARLSMDEDQVQLASANQPQNTPLHRLCCVMISYRPMDQPNCVAAVGTHRRLRHEPRPMRATWLLNPRFFLQKRIALVLAVGAEPPSTGGHGESYAAEATCHVRQSCWPCCQDIRGSCQMDHLCNEQTCQEMTLGEELPTARCAVRV
jgi:hypothetical protein